MLHQFFIEPVGSTSIGREDRKTPITLSRQRLDIGVFVVLGQFLADLALDHHTRVTLITNNSLFDLGDIGVHHYAVPDDLFSCRLFFPFPTIVTTTASNP